MQKKRKFVIASLEWVSPKLIFQPMVALTAYRDGGGIEDIFSIILFFEKKEIKTIGCKVKIYPLVEEMQGRLPDVGFCLLLTSGVEVVAKARVISSGADIINRDFPDEDYDQDP